MRNIAHKVVNILLLFLLSLVFFEDERFWSAETIMKFAYGFGVTENKSSIFRRKFFCELVELFQGAFDVDRCIKKN